MTTRPPVPPRWYPPTKRLVAEALQPPLPRLPDEAAASDAVGLVDQTVGDAAFVGNRVVSRREAEHAVALGLGGVSAYCIAHRSLAPLRPNAMLDVALARLAREHVPAAPVREGGREVGAIELTETERIRQAAWPELPLPLAAALPPWAVRRLPPLVSAAKGLGTALYLVGGAVRDLLLQLPVDDLDLMVDGDAIRLAEAVAARTGASLLSYPEFGTATLDWGGGEVIDLARARHETYPAPAALPVVQAGNAYSDLHRRDFTFNAMALRLDAAEPRVIDPFWGSLDLQPARSAESGPPVVRVLHALSFVDDPTRLFRAARFAGRWGGRLDPFTRRVAGLGIPFIERLSGERVRHELELLFLERSPEHGLALLQRWGVLRRIHAGLALPPGRIRWFAQARAAAARQPWAERDMGPSDLGLVYLLLLTWNASLDANRAIAKRLMAPRHAAHALAQAAQLRAVAPKLGRPGLRRSRLDELLHGVGTPALLAGAVALRSERARAAVETYQADVRWERNLLHGEDVLALVGGRAGPIVGRALRAARRAQLDGRFSEVEQARDWLRAWLAPRRRD